MPFTVGTIGDVQGGVVRVWKGYGAADGVQQYCAGHFRNSVLPQLQALAGFRGATVMTRSLGDETEVVVATTWDSIESVKAFAGNDYDAAVVEPVVRELLHHFDDRVTHYNVVVGS